jgi:hypothetical protein
LLDGGAETLVLNSVCAPAGVQHRAQDRRWHVQVVACPDLRIVEEDISITMMMPVIIICPKKTISFFMSKYRRRKKCFVRIILKYHINHTLDMLQIDHNSNAASPAPNSTEMASKVPKNSLILT